MSVRIRLSRVGAKKRPHYRIIVADSRSPRDGRFLERVGTYHPLLSRDDPDRVKLKLERIKYWLGKGAKPSGRVSKFLAAANLVSITVSNNPQKAKPKAKAQARLDELAKATEETKASEGESSSENPTESDRSVDSEDSPETEQVNAEVEGDAPAEEPEEESGGEVGGSDSGVEEDKG